MLLESVEDDDIDVLAVSPAPSNNSMNSQNSTSKEEKKYYCQRCLNHGLQFTRKGHKPLCQYATCNCSQCRMVEERRQLNNMLSRKKVPLPPAETVNGRRIRDPKCARCSAHGLKKPLRGHKKSSCPYYTCTCQLCNLVENRRSLMAKQIKLRRDQQRRRQAEENGGSVDERLIIEEKDSDDELKIVEEISPPVVVPRPVLPRPQQLPQSSSMTPIRSNISNLPLCSSSLPSTPTPVSGVSGVSMMMSSPSLMSAQSSFLPHPSLQSPPIPPIPFPSPMITPFSVQQQMQSYLLFANLCSQSQAQPVSPFPPNPSMFLNPAFKPLMSLLGFSNFVFPNSGL